MRCSRIALVVAAVIAMTAEVLAQAPLGAGFTYQGSLTDATGPVTGPCNLTFTLWDGPGVGTPPVGGIQIGGPDNNPATPVTEGLFTVQLNDTGQFGATAFTGEARWLQVSVNGTVLGPRQPVTAAPYALYALNAPTGSGWWQAVGNNISNSNSGFVGINRSTPVTGPEYFGVQAPVASGYGGMYIRTDGTNGLPFYGYRAGASGQSGWTYLDGASGDWRLNLDGDRMTVTDTGNVGIGSIAPVANLDIISATGDTEPGLRVYRQSTASLHDYLTIDGAAIDSEGNGFFGNALLLNTESGQNVLVGNDTNGRLGIGGGTSGLPIARLHVDGGTDTSPDDISGYVVIGATNGASISIDNNEIMARNDDVVSPLHLNANGGDIRMVQSGTGGVAIGTTTIPAGVKLAVNGKVLCEELEVQLAADWPDYVFADSYDLMSLRDVNEFVRRHKHLPGVPSADQIKSNGVNVGEMHATLLQKVEELTLHMIALDQRMQELTAENETLRARLAAESSPVAAADSGANAVRTEVAP